MECAARCAMTECLPECAAPTDSRTVRMRLRGDRPCAGAHVARAAGDSLGARTAGWEGCAGCRRARADCEPSDGGVVAGSRTLNRRRARSSCTVWKKYVNAAAALCVVLLAGGLRPAGGAPAPARHQMAREAARLVWRKPCGMTLEAYGRSSGTKNYDVIQASKVQNAAQKALENTTAYKDLLANQTQYDNFTLTMERLGSRPSVLLQDWCKLPQKAVGGKIGDPQYYAYAKANLPALYKYLELLTGAVDTIRTTGELSDADSYELRLRLNDTIYFMQMALCEFDLLLMKSGIQKLPSVEPHEVPVRSSVEAGAKESDFLIFRDTLSFLETLVEVFGIVGEEGQ